MDRFLNALKQQSAALDAARGQARYGVVASFDPATYTARVLLQPEGVLSGWLPILSGWVGSGWGLAAPPAPGDQVLVLAQEGDAEHGIIAGRAFSAAAPPPQAPVGEMWLVHASGAFVKLQNDGTVRIGGDLHVAGRIFDQQGALDTLRQDYDAHTHVDSRGGQTGTPSPQD
jgi:uncharacterized protein involved in type VI secretion and phage assembly